MRIKTLNYKHCELTFRSAFLSCIAVFILSGCGIKGDLYQTPDEPVSKASASNEQQVSQPEVSSPEEQPKEQ